MYVAYCTRKSPNSTYDSELSLVTPSLRLRGGATLRTLADGLVVDPILNDGFELCAEVRAVERVLADDRGLLVLAGFAVPAQTVWNPNHKQTGRKRRAQRNDTDRLSPPDGRAQRQSRWCSRIVQDYAGCWLRSETSFKTAHSAR